MTTINTPSDRIVQIRNRQLDFFRSGCTLDLNYRKAQLRRLGDALTRWESRLCDALKEDLHKSYEEAVMTELSIVAGEIRSHIRHLRRWAAPVCRPTPLKLFPSRSRVVSQPLGNALIIAPWNYPVQLLLNPLVGAISSGCTAVLKPSPYVPHVSEVIRLMIEESFPQDYIAVVEGNRTVNQALLDLRWDIIFFTGSPDLGRKVMEAASRNLTPVVLELGGKSPCIVGADADLETAARRIAWGKCLNAGQTCVAPDYLLVQEDVKDRFLDLLGREFGHLLGEDPEKSEHFVRIVNDKAFSRLESYLQYGRTVYGGKRNAQTRFFGPTILDGVSPDSPLMQEEIFGPIFPVLTFRTEDEALQFVNSRERPLAFYYFGKKGDRMLSGSISGGACINDTIMHLVNENLPFGGVGNSGLGAYHGKLSFDAFSHRRAVLSTCTRIDLPFRYMPYRFFNFVKKIL